MISQVQFYMLLEIHKQIFNRKLSKYLKTMPNFQQSQQLYYFRVGLSVEYNSSKKMVSSQPCLIKAGVKGTNKL